MFRRIFLAFLLAVSVSVALVAAHLIPVLQRAQRWHLESSLSKIEDLPGPRGAIRRSSGGAGPTLVLLHGFGDSAAGWSRVAEALSEDWTVVAIDLAGHGPSAPITPPLAMEDLLASVEIATADLGNELTFVGNSLGGWVSVRFALDHPARVRRLILINSAGLEHKVDKAVLMPIDRERVRERNRAVFGDHTPPAPWFVCDQLIELAKDRRLESLWNNLGLEPRLDTALPNLHTPTTLIWGTPDPLLPEDYAEALQAGLGAAEPTKLPGCGHSPQYSCPERLVEVVRQATK